MDRLKNMKEFKAEKVESLFESAFSKILVLLIITVLGFYAYNSKSIFLIMDKQIKVLETKLKSSDLDYDELLKVNRIFTENDKLIDKKMTIPGTWGQNYKVVLLFRESDTIMSKKLAANKKDAILKNLVNPKISNH